jgi:hypothetical protein
MAGIAAGGTMAGTAAGTASLAGIGGTGTTAIGTRSGPLQPLRLASLLGPLRGRQGGGGRIPGTRTMRTTTRITTSIDGAAWRGPRYA